MDRNAGTMLLCLLLGAAVMYGSTNYRIQVTPVGTPEPKAPGTVSNAEPGQLPEEVVGTRAVGKSRPGKVRPAAHAEGAGATTTTPISVTKITETVEVLSPTKDIVWAVKSSVDAPYLIGRKVKLEFNAKIDTRYWIQIGAQGKRASFDDAAFPYAGAVTITDDGGTVSIDFDHESLKDLKGEVLVILFDKTDGGNTSAGLSIGSQRFRIPSRVSANELRISVAQHRASPYTAFQSVSGNTPGAPLTVYTTTQKGTFLELNGSKPAGGTVNFVARVGTELIPLRTEPGETTAASGWDYQLRGLRLPASGTAVIATRHEFNGNEHVYAAEFVSVSATGLVEQLTPPTIALAPQDSTANKFKVAQPPNGAPGVWYTNTPDLTVTLGKIDANATDLVLYVDGKPFPQPKGTPTFTVTLSGDGEHVLRAIAVRGEVASEPVAQANVKLVTTGPSVVNVAAPGFGGGTGKEVITVQFRGEPLDPTTLTVGENQNFELRFDDGSPGGKPVSSAETLASYSPVTKLATLTFASKDIVPGRYKLIVRNKAKADVALVPASGSTPGTPAVVAGSGGVRDVFGNALIGPNGLDTGDNVEAPVLAFGDQTLPSQQAGVTLQTGPPVDYPIYLSPPKYPEGFNPSDRVESRVVRLYYYRDAHRVAQLINRAVKSYNAATVDVRRRAADRVRDDADKIRDERKQLEFRAIQAAQEARAAEAEVNNIQNRLTAARGLANQARVDASTKRAELDNARRRPAPPAEIARIQGELDVIERALTSADTTDRQGPNDLAAAQAKLASKREAEGKALESQMVKEFEERRIRENQFRVEVAAATADPDTYAPGRPESDDPVMRVSVSVIGEGLIQIRGPIKGLNVIRTITNQIDSPVGQVRVSVHTLQVNGERADRMEKVVANIQRYLDHSRFLTAQSGQMLRNAVTSVAARQAVEVQATLAPGCTQWDRDQRYLYAFFGKDFIDELIQLDSEFLKTGNKLLSLNSMDSTSLSAALFLLALAKNEVRTEIIQTFLASVQSELPEAEWKYYAAGVSQPKHCDACKDKKMYLLAFNSQFQSFIGFFSAQVTGTDTLNPLQREFIKLAQIFKAQMITEMQLRQRVMERSLLEERINVNYIEELRKAKTLEDQAKEELKAVDRERQDAVKKVVSSFGNLFSQFDDFANQYGVFAVEPIVGEDKKTYVQVAGRRLAAPLVGEAFSFDGPEWGNVLDHWQRVLDRKRRIVFVGEAADVFAKYEKLLMRVLTEKKATTEQLKSLNLFHKRLSDSVANTLADLRAAMGHLVTDLQAGKIDGNTFRSSYLTLKGGILKVLKGDTLTEAQRAFKDADLAVQTLGSAEFSYQAARKRAQAARRPLDEKKLLDLLVDEMEDKYVEILESMRAHTSNVDNYLKSVTTALDDDFNTQYYLPSFRRAREASRFWDVTLSQIETTSVLTNNRSLGKVSPAATFEFDLPKRDILLTEGFKSAKALFDEYGALMNDPSFLALAKIYSGNPVSMMQGGGSGLASVRSVLPSLPTSPDEKILAQQGPGQKQFGAALDGLIPDPAIYKFETGTGYEVRPVLSPDGQAVVFGFDYLYTTDVREPVRADEKHLGRVKRHFVHTDVQLGNFELREVSKYMVSIKVARTGKGVQLLQDIPGVGVLFRPLPSAGASLQQNLIYSQATIFPTLFDLMGLRYAPAVADLDPLADRMAEFAARYRRLDVEQRIYDIGATRVDDAIRTPYGERRYDLYRPQVSLPFVHPNGYTGLGLRLYDGTLREGYDVNSTFPDSRFAPGTSLEGRPKPYNFNTPPGYPSDVPLNYGPGHLPSYGPEVIAPSNARPLPPPRPSPPPMTAPMSPGANPNIMKLPGMGSVGVGRSVPYNPALPTTPLPARSELPTTSQQLLVTPGGPPVPRPSNPTPLPSYRPQPVGLPPAPPVSATTTGSR